MRPLTHGSILIVGAKASNLPVEITDNVRVTLWGSQDKRWLGKDIPVNTQAIFFTRWVGHNEFDGVMKQAREKRITVFQPLGTGLITKQVKELLGMNPVDSVSTNHIIMTTPLPVTNPMTHKYGKKGKLLPLAQFVDHSKTDKENGILLLAKAGELGIPTTMKSMTVFASREKRKLRGHIGRGPARVTKTVVTKSFPKYENDAVVEIFDNIMKELKDVREYLVQVTDENASLKARIKGFMNMLEGK